MQKCLLCPVAYGLPVGPCVIGRGTHGGKILPPLGACGRGTDEFPVRQWNPIAAGRVSHKPYLVVAYLVAKAPRTRMDHHEHLALSEPQGAGSVGVIDLVEILHLDEMVSSAEGAKLHRAAFIGAVADSAGVRALHGSAALGMFQVTFRAHATLHHELSTLDSAFFKLLAADLHPPFGTDSGGNSGVYARNKLMYLWGNIFPVKAGPQKPDPAVDVIAHTAGRDYPLIRVKGGNPANGEAIARMHVRHGKGGSNYTWQGGHVCHLLNALVAQQALKGLVRIDDAAGAHVRAQALWHLHALAVYPLKALRQRHFQDSFLHAPLYQP